jgi:hypothetical protein
MSIHQLHPHDQHPGQGWQAQLDRASSSADVVGLARDYLAQFSPYELHELPEPCRPPGKIVDGEDITSYAFALVQQDCNGIENAGLIHRLAHFFSSASVRLSQVIAQESCGQDDQRQTA